MCPFCIANLALIAAGTVSTGGLAAAITGKLRTNKKAQEISANFKRRPASPGASAGPLFDLAFAHAAAIKKENQHVTRSIASR